MKTIQLETIAGDFVCRREIPAFRKGLEPSAISWGTRVFLPTEDGVYRECFCYTIPLTADEKIRFLND